MGRILWIDRMRGLLMLSVVMQHLTIYIFDYDFIYLKWIGITNMSIFFFISAYLMSAATSKVDDFSKQIKFILKKTSQLMVPFLVWPLIIRRYFFQTNWTLLNVNDIVNEFKEPHLWFFLTLYGFCFIFIFYAMIENKSNKKIASIFLIVIAAVLNIIFLKFQIFKNAALYCSYFIFGIFVSRFNLIELLKNKTILSVSILTVFSILMFWNSGNTSILNVFIKMVVSFATIFLLYFLSSEFEWNKNIDKLILPLGSYSLAVYVIHWSFLPELTTKITIVNNELFAFLSVTIAGLIISFTCIGIYKFIQKLPLINLLFFGSRR